MFRPLLQHLQRGWIEQNMTRFLLVLMDGGVFIISINSDQKHPMICTHLKKTITSFPLLASWSRPFSKLSAKLQAGPFREYICKSSNIKFRGSEHSLIPYYSHPAIDNKSNNTGKYYQISESPVLTLNFVPDAPEEMMQQAWQNRRNINLFFRDVIQLMKLQPALKQQCKFRQAVYSQEIAGKQLTKYLRVAGLGEKGDVEMTIYQISVNSFTKEEDINWEVKIQLKAEDYAALVHSIANNLLYISGAKFSIEVTKQESLIEFDNYSFDQKQNSPYGKQSKQSPKKSPSKSSKVVKKQKN